MSNHELPEFDPTACYEVPSYGETVDVLANQAAWQILHDFGQETFLDAREFISNLDPTAESVAYLSSPVVNIVRDSGRVEEMRLTQAVRANNGMLLIDNFDSIFITYIDQDNRLSVYMLSKDSILFVAAPQRTPLREKDELYEDIATAERLLRQTENNDGVEAQFYPCIFDKTFNEYRESNDTESHGWIFADAGMLRLVDDEVYDRFTDLELTKVNLGRWGFTCELTEEELSLN